MPDILFISDNDNFYQDLCEQIALYAKDFHIIAKDDTATIPDLIIFDEEMPRLDELHHRNLKAPIFLLTSQPDHFKNSTEITNLIAKPFTLQGFLNELHVGISLYENSESGYLMFNQYIVKPVNKEILNKRNNETVKLTEKEVSILKYLFKMQDRIVGKNELLQEVWGYSPEVTTHTIETHIYRLRQKVEHDDLNAQLILTVDGGYQLKV